MISPQKKYRVIVKDENKLDLDSSYSNKEIVGKILKNRSIDENSVDNFLKNSDINSVNPYELKDLDKVIELLSDFIVSKKTIGIYGDFDADGDTASAVAIKALRMMGTKFVDLLVPNRFEHGYGLSPEIVNEAKKEKDPELIITVDNGISSIEGTSLARSLGIDVIITDHHLPPNILPDANAIINPNLKDCKFPSKNLAGVGVCFYLYSTLKTPLLGVNYYDKHIISGPDLSE